MSGNVFGRIFRVSAFGESHGPATGCLVDGCPAGMPLSPEDVSRELARRRPGGGFPATPRDEGDEAEILSGVFEGKTLGTPILILVRNTAHDPADYDSLRDLYRPGHADWTWEAKYGLRDHRGGGRASGRETLGRVAAGAVAKRFLAGRGVSVRAWTQEAAGIAAPGPAGPGFDLAEAEANPLRMPHRETALRALAELEKIAAAGDSAGGIVACRVTGLPPGLGEPVFDKIDALLGAAILSIGAVKGVEFGAGFAVAAGRGSALNDSPLSAPGDSAPGGDFAPGGSPAFSTNHSGGILGGISTGMPLEFRAAFKPVPSISRPQQTVDRLGRPRNLEILGRHDVCICPRAVPVVEAMTALVLADLLLLSLASSGGDDSCGGAKISLDETRSLALGLSMRVLKNTWFTRFASKEGIGDGDLKGIADQLEAGQAEANLGGGVYKVRLARPGAGKSGGYRVIVFFRTKSRTLFAYGFGKSDRDNISRGELQAFKDDAKYALALTESQIAALLKKGTFKEIL